MRRLFVCSAYFSPTVLVVGSSGVVPLLRGSTACVGTSSSSSTSCGLHVTAATRGIGTHVANDGSGLPSMVDITAKVPSVRVAVAAATIRFPPAVSDAIREHCTTSTTKGATAAVSELDSEHPPQQSDKKIVEVTFKKGPVLATAVVAATMAVKQTSNVIPFCHPLPIERCKLDFVFSPSVDTLTVRCEVGTSHKTGVEMEALHGASVAALTVYDMLKGIEGAQPHMEISAVQLVKKDGGKHGLIERGEK